MLAPLARSDVGRKLSSVDSLWTVGKKKVGEVAVAATVARKRSGMWEQ